jgi:spore coat polysaccharide biosynthesis protein SpsF
MSKVVAIIQARMNSNRLPGKVLRKIAGRELLARVVDRVNLCKKINSIVVATGDIDDNKEITEYCNNNNINVFCGDENNVLERFYFCAKEYNADIIVRITADDPFKDPKIIDYAVNSILENTNIDYISNTIEPTFPEGLDIEVFKFLSFEKAYKEANLLSEKEHVTPYIWKNSNIFNVKNFKYKKDLSFMRLTIDYIEDLILSETIYNFFNDKEVFYLDDILFFLDNNKDLIKNYDIPLRNEGYLISCANDDLNGENAKNN